MSDKSRIVVLGLGNELLKDEGIGVHAVRRLRKMPGLGGVEVVEGGIQPDAPLDYGGVGKLIIVDAVLAGGEPGTIYRCRPEDVDRVGSPLTSLHQISLLDTLRLMEQLGQKPGEVIIIGIEPESMDYGMEMTPRLQEKLPHVVEMVLKEAGVSS